MMLFDGGVLIGNSANRETIHLKTQAPPMNRGIEPLRPRNVVTNLDGVMALILTRICDF